MAKLTIADRLERASAKLDRLIAEARLDRPGACQFDDMEERAQAIAADIVATFRGDRAPTAAPLAVRIQHGGKSSAWY